MQYINRLPGSRILCYVSLFLMLLSANWSQAQTVYDIREQEKGVIMLQAGPMQRVISADASGFRTEHIRINNKEVLQGKISEVSFYLHKASPNKQPEGLRDVPGDAVQVKDELAETDELSIAGKQGKVNQHVKWIGIAEFHASEWGKTLNQRNVIISGPDRGKKQLRIRYRNNEQAELNGLFVDVVYEVYEGYPAIRKWVEVTNNSTLWLKLDSLVIDDISIADTYHQLTDLTPSGRGAVSSIRAFSDPLKENGLLQVSEIPSALRAISDKGAMGYNPQHFEWVLGPAERFISEPVSSYAFSGKSHKTISSASYSLDREIEGLFQQYLLNVVGVKSADAQSVTPMWCSWSNYGPAINEQNMSKAAEIAAAIGIKTLLLDAGWSEAKTPKAIVRYSTVPDRNNFPDFSKMADNIHSKGLNLGLWVTCYRHPTYSADLQALPQAYSLPRVERDGALAMSFTSPWRFYYAHDLLKLNDLYGVTYFKQDLTNVKFGDIASGHDSRTQKESLLRGLRGLFEAQDVIAEMAPQIRMELTHEIYWGTPGTPCDVAALKHAHYFHVPPNDYSGAGQIKQRVADQRKYNTDSLQMRLIRGCWNARRQFFAHRGLPLQSIEYYGAATVNLAGSLSPQIQQRQLCSWFMGAPSVYAGDLESLTRENIAVYQEGFSLLKRLDEQYGVYRHFQYSGVPEPTDTDWHWWGKLNNQGHGAVVVMRGSKGESSRKINIPWVISNARYKVRKSFANTELGTFSGDELINGKLVLSLDPYTQEILELMPLKTVVKAKAPQIIKKNKLLLKKQTT